MDFMWFCCMGHPRVVSKKVGIPVSGFQSSDASSRRLLVKVPERNSVELPNSTVPLKNKSWGRNSESCKNHNIERDLKGTKNPCNA